MLLYVTVLFAAAAELDRARSTLVRYPILGRKPRNDDDDDSSPLPSTSPAHPAPDACLVRSGDRHHRQRSRRRRPIRTADLAPHPRRLVEMPRTRGQGVGRRGGAVASDGAARQEQDDRREGGQSRPVAGCLPPLMRPLFGTICSRPYCSRRSISSPSVDTKTRSPCPPSSTGMPHQAQARAQRLPKRRPLSESEVVSYKVRPRVQTEIDRFDWTSLLFLSLSSQDSARSCRRRPLRRRLWRPTLRRSTCSSLSRPSPSRSPPPKSRLPRTPRNQQPTSSRSFPRTVSCGDGPRTRCSAGRSWLARSDLKGRASGG